MSTQLSSFHALAYMGADLSRFSAEIAFYEDTSTGKIHGRSRCYKRGRTAITTAVRRDPTKVPASKACSSCFDDALEANPIWYSLKKVPSYYMEDRARFVRTALNEKSRKNSEEDRAKMANSLDNIKDYMTAPLGNAEALDIYEAMIDKINRRIEDLRGSLKEGPLGDKMLRLTAAAAALYPKARALDPFLQVRELGDFEPAARVESRREIIRRVEQLWSDAMVEEGDLEAVKEKIRAFLKSTSMFSKASQTNFIPETTYQPGSPVKPWLEENWLIAFDREIEKTFERLDESYQAALHQEEYVFALVHVFPDTSLDVLGIDTLSARAYPAMLDLFKLRSKGVAHIVFMRKKVFESFTGGATSSYEYRSNPPRVIAKLDVTGVSHKVAETAATLYDFSSPEIASDALKTNLESALALESE